MLPIFVSLRLPFLVEATEFQVSGKSKTVDFKKEDVLKNQVICNKFKP